MADHKREMDIAAQLRLTAEHSRSKGPLLREAAEVIETLTFRVAELTKELEGDYAEITKQVLYAMGILPQPSKGQESEQNEAEWILYYRSIERICQKNRESLELRKLDRNLRKLRAALVPKWIIRLIERLNPEE